MSNLSTISIKYKKGYNVTHHKTYFMIICQEKGVYNKLIYKRRVN